jgi:hypothetical protein
MYYKIVKVNVFLCLWFDFLLILWAWLKDETFTKYYPAFSSMINSIRIYVDKTQYIYNLIAADNLYFLSDLADLEKAFK